MTKDTLPCASPDHSACLSFQESYAQATCNLARIVESLSVVRGDLANILTAFLDDHYCVSLALCRCRQHAILHTKKLTLRGKLLVYGREWLCCEVNLKGSHGIAMSGTLSCYQSKRAVSFRRRLRLTCAPSKRSNFYSTAWRSGELAFAWGDRKREVRELSPS